MKGLLLGLGIGVLVAALAGCEDDPRDLDYLKDAGTRPAFDAGHAGGSGGSGGSSAGGSGGGAGTTGGSGGSGGSTQAGSGGSSSDQDAG